MPTPNSSSSLSKLAGNSARAFSYLGIGVFGYVSYHDRLKRGWNPAAAAVASTAEQALPFLVHPALYLGVAVGLPAARAAGQLITSTINHNVNQTRVARTPFSQRFEHSDMTSMVQSRGLQAIGSAWAHRNMGSEASTFARRFGR